MNTTFKTAQRAGALALLVLLASAATPALADHDDDDGYRGRGYYDAPRYDHYYERGGRGRGHDYRRRDRDVYYVTPYYAPRPRVIYAPPPVVYYPPSRPGIDVHLHDLF